MAISIRDIVIRIFVEGIADQVFLFDIIQYWYGLDGDKKNFLLKIRDDQYVQILKSGDKGDSGGKSYYITKEGWEKQKTQFGFPGTNLIIIDSDDGREETLAALRGTIDISDFPFDSQLYLWPDNQSNGELENLLERIINPENQPILHCWSAFESCISQIEGRTLTLPANKTKVYAYLETLLGDSNSEKEKIKERNRDYTNPNHWNLDPTNTNLSPLKTFLDRHLLDNSITL